MKHFNSKKYNNMYKRWQCEPFLMCKDSKAINGLYSFIRCDGCCCSVGFFSPLFERDIVVASDSALNVRKTNRTEMVDRKWGMSIRRNKVENEKQLLVKRTLES